MNQKILKEILMNQEKILIVLLMKKKNLKNERDEKLKLYLKRNMEYEQMKKEVKTLEK